MIARYIPSPCPHAENASHANHEYEPCAEKDEVPPPDGIGKGIDGVSWGEGGPGEINEGGWEGGGRTGGGVAVVDAFSRFGGKGARRAGDAACAAVVCFVVGMVGSDDCR